MDKNDMKSILLAIVRTLDEIQLRTDQVHSAARINACSNKLSEIVTKMQEVEETEHAAENQQGE